MPTQNAVKEKPILFSGPMVRAILDGRKSVTRRIAKLNASGRVYRAGKNWHVGDPDAALACPFGVPGDRLWVKEAWRPSIAHGCTPNDPCDCGNVNVEYSADKSNRFFDDYKDEIPDEWTIPKAAKCGKVTPLFMPRWASRLTLEVVSVRVERLQEISIADICAEGVVKLDPVSQYIRSTMSQYQRDANTRHLFSLGWDEINGKRGSWASNPWVWRIEFKRLA